ncbi:urease accessory protein UreD [uncultured Clostridium sp.]|uniref:urease accessory protein UreD n=1 Tax=uncultured Clostridium sp. TaxID=59620 RepID=UPI002632925C|nr:urease accessory protein UreD [uncultured Clostridium sp.]
MQKDGINSYENYDAYIDIVFENRNEKTITTKRKCDGAMRISSTLYLDKEKIPAYFLVQIGGGYVEGEKFHYEIEAKENTRAMLLTQSSTKIYKCENGEETTQNTYIKLEKNSVLEYINDPIILYKDAKYRQENNVYMDEDSTFIYTDGITAGWSPDGENFRYNRAKLKTNLYVNDTLMFLDNLVLEPSESNLRGVGYLEGYLNFGTLLIIDKKVNDKFIDSLRENLEEKLKEYDFNISYGISKLEVNGFVLRILGNLTQDIEKVISICHDFSREKILNSIPLVIRKY